MKKGDLVVVVDPRTGIRPGKYRTLVYEFISGGAAWEPLWKVSTSSSSVRSEVETVISKFYTRKWASVSSTQRT